MTGRTDGAALDAAALSTGGLSTGALPSGALEVTGALDAKTELGIDEERDAAVVGPTHAAAPTTSTVAATSAAADRSIPITSGQER